MHARLGLGPAVRVVTLDEERAGLDAGLLALRLVDHVDLEAVPLRPAQIHAHEHARPVLALRAARARMHFEVGVVAVRLALEQRVDLAAVGLGQERAERRKSLALRIAIALALAEFDKGHGIVEIAVEFRERAQPVLEIGALAHDLLCSVGIGPEPRVLDAGVQFGETPCCAIDVKDASSAGRATA